MAKKVETRGRKPKKVDAEMFKLLIDYYKKKPIKYVTECEKSLASFVKRFSPYSQHFESLQAAYKKEKECNPHADH